MITTLGRQLVRSVLPQKYKNRADTPMDKKTIKKLTTQLAKQNPDQYVQILDKLNRIGQGAVTGYGRQTGITLDDVDSGKPVKQFVAKFNKLIRGILADKKLSNQQKQRKVIQLGYRYSPKIQDAVIKDHQSRYTALYSQLASGSRGSPIQIAQLNFGDMGVRDAMNRDMPYFSSSPRAGGASSMAMWVGASSSRKGFYDVQAMTGRAGYLGKQASNATHNVPICQQDCGTTDTGQAVPANNDAVGAILIRPFKKYPAGTVVTQQMLEHADPDTDQLIVRSPTTCLSAHGVCAHCSGLNQNGKFPAVGQYVALNASKTFIEKATQAGVGSKHAGGVGGKKNDNPQGQDQPTGMDQLQRMFYVPSTFKGGAVLARHDGVVNSIKQAPQGGHYIIVGNDTIYAPQQRTVNVKPGQSVIAGDKLTNGVPNPVQIVQYKGLGQGRRYFANQLAKTLTKNGWGVNKRNVQQYTRGFLNKVQITDPDGFASYLPGDIVDYSDVQAAWQPREDSKQLTLTQARNKYLQKPVLHYTVGTRITPAVAQTLKKYNFNKILVNDKQPPFKDRFIRSTDIVLHDKNWMPRLMGQRLQQATFDAAQQGITDTYDSPSYVDRVIATPYKP